MYYMSESEFMQYERAEMQLKELRIQHHEEMKQAYDGIHPTRVRFDYSLGIIYSESVNPADYAIYLIELREDHERQEKWWEMRALTFREALTQLTTEERACLNSYDYGSFGKREKSRKKLREILSTIVSKRHELQRKLIQFDELEDLEEVDRQIEKMSMKELLEDYWDKDEDLIKKDNMKKSAKETSNSVSKPTCLYPVSISFLPLDELEKYRRGEKGGSKWFSYEDYLKMKKARRTNKEIALAMGIEPSELNKRVKAWRFKDLQLDSDVKVKAK